jgi:hypothetical protein
MATASRSLSDLANALLQPKQVETPPASSFMSPST